MGHHFSLPPSLSFFKQASSSNRLQTASGWSRTRRLSRGWQAPQQQWSMKAFGYSDLRGLSAEPWRGIMRKSSDKGSPRDHCHFYGWDKRAGNYWDKSRESLWEGTAFSLSPLLPKDLPILLTLSSGRGLGTNSVGSDSTFHLATEGQGHNKNMWTSGNEVYLVSPRGKKMTICSLCKDDF